METGRLISGYLISSCGAEGSSADPGGESATRRGLFDFPTWASRVIFQPKPPIGLHYQCMSTWMILLHDVDKQIS